MISHLQPGISTNTPLERLNVPVQPRPYSILIGTDWWNQIPTVIAETLNDLEHAIVIADAAIKTSWSERLINGFQDTNIRVDALEISSGETSKSVEHLQSLWESLLKCRADRRSVVIAVGGGVIGDLAGFAAATYSRGIRLVQVPTTLLAQVDSSVGGKTGINLPNAKNMVGSFWQPSLVAIDTLTLSTLPERIFISGLAEVIKYGVIADAEFFAWLESNMSKLIQRDNEAIRIAIVRSCQAKADVVAADERETTGVRATLNYGHTFGHAIEATAGYGQFLHGEAIAIGMQMAARLALQLGRIQQNFIDRQTVLLKQAGLPIHWEQVDEDAMLGAMASDKKVAYGKLRLVLPTLIGHVETVDEVPEDLIRKAIRI